MKKNSVIEYKIMLEKLKDMPDVLLAEDLVNLGVYTTEGDACRYRKNSVGPSFTTIGHRVFYTNNSLRLYIEDIIKKSAILAESKQTMLMPPEYESNSAYSTSMSLHNDIIVWIDDVRLKIHKNTGCSLHRGEIVEGIVLFARRFSENIHECRNCKDIYAMLNINLSKNKE